MPRHKNSCPHCWRINCPDLKAGKKHSLPKEVKKALKVLYVGGVVPDPAKEKAKNWIFGAGRVWPIINKLGKWLSFLPTPNKQATSKFDPFSCVSESLVNALETLLNYLMTVNPAIRPILQTLGMLDEFGKAKLSARFLAVMSGTVAGRGNSQWKVFETLRNGGIVGEKHWPTREDMSEEEYFATIPQEIKDLALQFCNDLSAEILKQRPDLEPFFTFNYEDIPEDNKSLKEATKRGTVVVCVGGAYLGKYKGALLYRNNGTPLYNHQAMYAEQEENVPDFSQTIPIIHDIFDTYLPFLKKFYEKYPFGFAKVVYLTLNPKKSMFRLIKTKSKSATYLHAMASNERWGIGDSISKKEDGTPKVPGGDLLKSLSGTYKNAAIQTISEEEMAAITDRGLIRAD